MPTARSSSAARADLAAHDRAGEDEEARPGQVGDGPHGAGDVRLADERDRVDRDALAAEVVAVGLAHGAEGDLGDLGAAADDDDPLAEDPVEGAGGVALADAGRAGDRRVDDLLVEPLDLDLGLDRGEPAAPSAPRRRTVLIVRTVPPAAATTARIAGSASGRSSWMTRIATVGGWLRRRDGGSSALIAGLMGRSARRRSAGGSAVREGAGHVGQRAGRGEAVRVRRVVLVERDARGR